MMASTDFEPAQSNRRMQTALCLFRPDRETNGLAALRNVDAR